jgi:uncharacterized protein YgiM (DUF1202 family)
LTKSENEDLRERKFDLWLKVNLAINGLITLALTYYYYSELFNSKEDISELIWLCILGLVCWIVWFQLVSNYDKYFFKEITPIGQDSDATNVPGMQPLSSEAPRNNKSLKMVLVSVVAFAAVASLLWYNFKGNDDGLKASPNVKADQSGLSEQARQTSNSNASAGNIDQGQPVTYNGLDIMTQYYNQSNEGSLNAYSFFDSSVDQFINKKNTNPSEIQSIINGNDEFLEKNSIPDAQSWRYSRTVDGIDYFDYWLFFHCYRVSKQKIQECRINIEVGFTQSGKIRSYVEKNVTDLVFKEPGDRDAVIAYIIDPPSNLRSCPNTSCEVVAECSVKGEQVKVISVDGNWALVETQNGARGYLHSSQYAQNTSGKLFTATVDKLRFRETPSFNGVVIREVSMGTTFTFLNEQTNMLETAKIAGQELSGYWYRVRAQDGREGWVHGCCISGI